MHIHRRIHVRIYIYAHKYPPAPACQGPPGCVSRFNPVSSILVCILHPEYRIQDPGGTIWMVHWASKPTLHPPLPLCGTLLEPPLKSMAYQISLVHASKAQLEPEWIQKVPKVSKMEPKAVKKRTLKWEWTPFCYKTADMQFDLLFTVYYTGGPFTTHIIVY